MSDLGPCRRCGATGHDRWRGRTCAECDGTGQKQPKPVGDADQVWAWLDQQTELICSTSFWRDRGDIYRCRVVDGVGIAIARQGYWTSSRTEWAPCDKELGVVGVHRISGSTKCTWHVGTLQKPGNLGRVYPNMLVPRVQNLR